MEEEEGGVFRVMVSVVGPTYRLVLMPHAADWVWVTAELARRFGASWPAKPVITCEVETVRKYHCALENEEDWKDLKQATKASSSADHTIHMTVRDA